MNPVRWLLSAVVLGLGAVLAVLGIAGGDVLSGLRAADAAQGRWGQAVDEAVYDIERYARRWDAADAESARRALIGPLAQRQAREALQRGAGAATAGPAWRRAGVHPDDVQVLARLHRHYVHLPFLQAAVPLWRAGDEALGGLASLLDDMDAAAMAARQGGDALDGAEAGRLSRVTVEALARLTTYRQALEQSAQQLGGVQDDGARLMQRIVNGSFALLGLGLGSALCLVVLRLMRRQAVTEQALRASNERWEMAAEGSSIGVFDWDVQRGHCVLDVRAAAMWGWDTDRPIVRSDEMLRALVHPEDQPRLRRVLSDALRHGRTADVRFRITTPEGGERHLELNGRASDYAGRGAQRARRMVGLMWDVSVDVQAERLRLERDAAERANLAKTAFLSRVSHELRTPLNAILGFAQLLQHDPREPLSTAQAERVAHILAGGEHLLGLINDVLDLSVIDQGAFAVTARRVDLTPMLRDSVARFEPIARGRRVQVALAIEPTGVPCFVEADPLRLEQVFVNLISNAIKYNRVGGRVDVLCRVEDDSVRVEVRDTGPGLSAEQQAQLFQPFNRLGAEYSGVPGSGLGLVITRQLVERMGGTLTLDSAPGDGARFSVRLPRVEADSRSAGAAGLHVVTAPAQSPPARLARTA